ncbi:MAG: cystathionine gamma-synthase [Rickettsiales bacterium]|nr:cystathionine gamma-synthase [Rickettsiales bacterium]|tara:strand:- start:1981 stop:3183 length:1203 start_codon:yes stop_codon:yes gene_type:complete
MSTVKPWPPRDDLCEGNGFGTRAIHAGQPAEPVTGAVMVPIYQTSTFVQEGVGGHKGYEYARTGNPTRTALETCLASLEGARHGVCFSSGCAATSTVLHSLSPGDHVVSSDDVYGGTWRIFETVFRPLGIEFTYVDLCDLDAAQAALRPGQTRLLWIETPTNPLLKVIDIAQMAELAHSVGARALVDNTFATPYFQSPLALGADAVLHSTTKYLGGHSDVVGGAVITNEDEFAAEMFRLQNSIGATPGPQDCFLTLRGIKTLHVRMDRHQRSAMALARFLSEHEDVERVIYPGLESHPQHEVAARQMHGFGGMLSFELRADLARAERFVSSTQVMTLAESLGGVESLIELPAAMTHASVPPDVRQAIGIADGLVRLSVGLEDEQDLREDLEQAFARSRQP